MKYKDSNLYKRYLELNSNPKTKAVISLFFWILFFIIVVLFARGSGNKNVNKKNEIINDRINSYVYTYSDNKNVIYGKVYGSNYLFNLQNHEYYYDSNDVYEVINHNLIKVSDFDVSYLNITPNMISDLTENLNYSLEGDAFVYNVPLINFMNLFCKDVPVNLEDIEKYNIVVKKYYLNDKLCTVILDLSSYYNYNKIDDNGILTIDYYEQNKVNDFTSEYDGMIGVIK